MTASQKKNTIQLHNMETIKIPTLQEDMKENFEYSLERKLPKRKREFNHAINLIINTFLRPLLLHYKQMIKHLPNNI